MHPPDCRLDHRLSDWPDYTLELRCPCSPRMLQMPLRLLVVERGDRTFGALLAALRCSKCRDKPAPVYLIAGFHRTFCGGLGACWSLELVPAPGQRPAPTRAT